MMAGFALGAFGAPARFLFFFALFAPDAFNDGQLFVGLFAGVI
jgi:hypothetical protein